MACEAHHAWCRPWATALLPGPLRQPAEAWTRGPGAYHHDRLETCGGTPGGAAWTVRTQPAWTVPWRPAIAACAAWRSAIATEPRPCERARLPVDRDVDHAHRAIGREELAEVIRRHMGRQITHSNVHTSPLWGKSRATSTRASAQDARAHDGSVTPYPMRHAVIP